MRCSFGIDISYSSAPDNSNAAQDVPILTAAHTYVRYGTFCMTRLRRAMTLRDRGIIASHDHASMPSHTVSFRARRLFATRVPHFSLFFREVGSTDRVGRPALSEVEGTLLSDDFDLAFGKVLLLGRHGFSHAGCPFQHTVIPSKKIIRDANDLRR